MFKKKFLAFAGIGLVSASLLAACGSNSSSGSSAETTYPTEVTNDGTAIDGGTLKYAEVSAASSTGLLIDELTSVKVDSDFGAMVDISMFGWDGDRKLDDSGLATATIDADAKTVTVKLTGEDYKWSDGQAFTIDDYIFTIKSMASPDYTGVRFDEKFTNIVGMDEYVAGTASDISGIEKVDDYTVVLTVKEITPSMQIAGGNIPAYVMPKHIYENIAVADWESSEYSRTEKHVGMGPFIIESYTSGESYKFVPNPYYYKGDLQIDGVQMDIVSPDTIVSEMAAGNYDVAIMPSDQLDSYQDLSNITLVGELEFSYEYISFNLGTYNSETGENEMNEDAKMNNVNLRQAIGYALDNETAGKSLYNGLYHQATSLVISAFTTEHDSDIEGYTYDPDKAEELLDEAGYVDTDGDSYREDPDGNQLTISLAARTRTSANETLLQQYIEWWKEVGLRVELYTGRTIELNTFYDLIMANDENIDMYVGGWSTGYDPDPTGLWGPEAMYNMSRFVSDENTELLDAITSEASMDEDTLIKNYKAWQEYAFEQAFAIPTFESEAVTAVNNRVKHWDTYLGSASEGSNAAWDKVQLVSDTAEVSE